MPNHHPGKRLQILLAAPSDVRAERLAIERIVQAWNENRSKEAGTVLELVSWKTSSYPSTGGRPQALLNRQLVDTSDIVVGVFWTKFGSPTGIFQSGTEEEIRRSINQKKRVLVYFSDRPVPVSKVDRVQYERIIKFKEDFGREGLYWTFSSLSEFKANFLRHLDSVVREISLGTPASRINSRFSPDYLGFITSTRHQIFCSFTILNRRGDTRFSRRDAIHLIGDGPIDRTPRINLFTPVQQKFAIPIPKVNKGSMPRARLIGVQDELTVEQISKNGYIKHSWWYRIVPPLRTHGDIADFTIELVAKKQESDAFIDSGSELFVVNQLNVQHTSLILATGVKRTVLKILDCFSENREGKRYKIQKVDRPRMSVDGSTISWDITGNDQNRRFVLQYRIVDQRN